ncbi:LysR family transcriptional regulator [Enterococcus sp. AZ163]|uniref:LysR family transcriptional regulator n=1 Tax=Enterococcus sp. AZ163 TaxID=2774638 RepID=UPI003D2D0CC0
MSIEKLEYFYVIAKYNSLSKASQELYVSISSLSSALKSLENELGYDLFVRQGKRLMLSESGEKILPAVEKILEEVKKIQFPLYQRIDQPIFRVGVSESVLIFEANECTVKRERYPINYINAAPLDLLNRLKGRELDFVITNSLVEDSQLERALLIHSKILIVAHESLVKSDLSEITSKDLEKRPFIILTDQLGHRQLTQKIAVFFNIIPQFLYCHDSLGVQKWINENRGFLVIHAAEKELLSSDTIKFFSLPNEMEIDYYLYKNRNNDQLFNLGDVEEYLKEVFAEIEGQDNRN